MNKIFPTDAPNILSRMHECGAGSYWYYHKGSYPNDPPLHYQQLISSATTYVEIWDPHVNIGNGSNDLEIFDNVPVNITLKILTKKGLAGINQTFLSDLHIGLKTRIPPSKNLRFGLRVFDKGDKANYESWFFHDRFLIIDQTDVFIIGSSIGWHVKSVESTGIFKVDKVETRAFIKSIFEEYWKQAFSNEIPIQYLHP